MFSVRPKNRLIKIFYSYILVIMVPLLVISGGYIYNAYNRVKENYLTDMEKNLKTTVRTVDNILNSMDTTSMQISFLPIVNQILSNPSEAEIYNYVQLQRTMDNYVFTTNILHSMYLYCKISNTVVTQGDGIVAKDVFYDKELIDDILANEDNSKWYATRRIINKKTYMSTNDDVITISRKIPVLGVMPLGNLVLNIKQDILSDVLDRSLDGSFEGVFVVDGEGKIIINKDKDILYSNIENMGGDLKSFSDKTRFDRIKINNKSYFASYVKSDIAEWTYIGFTPSNAVSTDIKKEIVVVLTVFFIALLLGIPVSYMVALKMYEPLKKLTSKLITEMQSFVDNEDKNDEYGIVEGTISRLISVNKNIQEISDRNKPIIKEKLISDLLFNNYVNLNEFTKKLEYAGIRFSGKSHIPFTVLVSGLKDIERVDMQEDLRFFIKEIVENSFSAFATAWGILLEDNKLAFVFDLNMDAIDEKEKEKILSICNQINQNVGASFSLKLFFSFGPLCRELNKISESFIMSRNPINYKALVSEECAYFCDELQDELIYPITLQRQLITGVRSKNVQLTDEVIDRLFDEYIFGRNHSQEKLHHMIILLISGTINGIWQEEGEFENLLNYNFSSDIQKAESPTSLKSYMKKYFQDIIISMKDKDELLEGSHYIKKIIRFVNENYSKNISANDVAEYINLNSSYLARVFKSVTGRTLTEYITKVRIVKAKELLMTKGLTVQEIGLSVGYTDVHSFIRAFKKSEGMTPGYYCNSMEKI